MSLLLLLLMLLYKQDKSPLLRFGVFTLLLFVYKQFTIIYIYNNIKLLYVCIKIKFVKLEKKNASLLIFPDSFSSRQWVDYK